MNRLLIILIITCCCNIVSAQRDYRQISESAVDSIIKLTQKRGDAKKYKQVDLDSYVLQGERVMFTAKWTGNLSKYRCALPLYDSHSAVVYSCRNKKDNKESWDEENHIDFSGITIVLNGIKQYIPLSGNFPQFDELNRNAGANYDMIITGLVVTSVNKKDVNPTLIIENVKILK